MLTKLSVTLTLLAMLSSGVEAFSTGAPSSKCTSMEPGHGRTAQSSPLPYTLTVSKSTYTPGEDLIIKLDGQGKTYKGFLVQARRQGSTTPVGTFSDPSSNTKIVSCSRADNSWTHSYNNLKSSSAVKWSPPDSDVGDIEFLVTVVSSYATYWVAVKTTTLTFSAGLADPCSPTPCQNGGICSRVDASSYSCTCPAEYQGPHCETPNPCVPNPCLNGGMCSPPAGTCTCVGDWQGRYCDQAVDVCSPNPCLNNGVCVRQGASYVCQCAPGFEGPVCQTKNNLCLPNPCMHDGICEVMRGSTGIVCQCQPGYIGRRCETPNPCMPNPCRNGGTCSLEGLGYTCRCPSGFDGFQCEIQNPCLPNPCKNNGMCERSRTGFECRCTPRYAGPRCERDNEVLLPTEPRTGRITPKPTSGTDPNSQSVQPTGAATRRSASAATTIIMSITLFCLVR